MNCEICVIGSEAFLFPFLQFGFRSFTPSSPRALREYLEEVISLGFGVIYLEDSFCFQVEDILDKCWDQQTPIIVPIGGLSESESYSWQMGREMMEKAIGMHVL